MSHFFLSFAQCISHKGTLLLGAAALFLGPLTGRAQALQFQQNFEGTTVSSPIITYKGNALITTGKTVTENGRPRNAEYYSEATGATATHAWSLENGGTVVNGTATVSQTIEFDNIRFSTGSTGNRVEFLLTALSKTPNNGIFLDDQVRVEISPDYGTTYYPTVIVTGNSGTGFPDGVVWGYQGNAIAPGSLTAIGTFNGNSPLAVPTTSTPTLLTSISGNNNSQGNNNTLTGAGGYGKVRIDFINALNVRVRITLTNSRNNQVWGIDEFKVFSSGATALPVELTRFDAQAKDQSVNVNWATAAEKNSDRFEIQRSATGEAFETVGTVKGQGNTSSAHNYAFVDSRPLAGRSYYRLRQVDIDGTTAYSPVATVQVRNELAVYPNPSAGIVTLPATLGDVHYRLLNTIGQTLLSGQATGNDQLDLTKLAKGTFFLELTGEAGRTTQRLIRE